MSKVKQDTFGAVFEQLQNTSNVDKSELSFSLRPCVMQIAARDYDAILVP